MKSNSIGLNDEKTLEVATDLNLLLADFQIYYQNLRGAHWNVRGPHFFTLHIKFEELYREAQENIDIIAERILTLGLTPLHTFQDYINKTSLSIGKNIFHDKECVQLIITSISNLLYKERKILEVSGDNKDEATNSIISDIITSQEKNLWMFKAWLGEKV